MRTYPVESVISLREARDNIVSSGHLSLESIQLLRMAGVTEEKALSEYTLFDPEAQLLEPHVKRYYLHSELALAKALKTRDKDPGTAVGNYLVAANYALKGMFEPVCQTGLSLMCDNLKIFYARALIGLLEHLVSQNWKEDEQLFRPPNEPGYVLRLFRQTEFEDPRNYESIRPSALIAIKGLANRHLRYGIGVPLTAYRAKRGNDPQDRFLPLVGTCVPLTAVLQFPSPETASGELNAQLELHNAFRTETVIVNDRELPLAANFSAPFASLIEKIGQSNLATKLAAFDSNGEFSKKEGIYSIEPYDAQRIPLVTVHGLFSSPLTWVSIHNDLMGDEVIRRNFQIWHYLYPTNLPILESAKTFRAKLDDLEEHLRTTTGSSRRGMVIVAHSMGGLLVKTSIVQDDMMKKFLFDPSADFEKLDSHVQAGLDDYLRFQQRTYIDRVIFIAVPHHGSDIADNWIGRLGRGLMRLPPRVAKNMTGILRQARAMLRPEVRDAVDFKDLSSIRGLSRANPIIDALSRLTIAPDIPVHSIIGDRGKGGGLASSDGVVDYGSSHLDSAESELIVPADHSAHLHPLAIQEIRRILHLHLTKLDPSAQAELPPSGEPLPIR